MNNDIFNYIPEKIKLSILSNDKEEEKEEKLTEEEQNLIKINVNYLESKIWYWKKDENFEFILPPTIFTKKDVIRNEHDLRYNDEIIHYENPDIVGQRFSQDILDQIWQKGEFVINSNEPELPYTWKLSRLTVKGIQNIKYRYREDMSISFFFLYSLYYRFSTFNYKGLFPGSFPSSFYHLYFSIYEIINLFLGLPVYADNKFEIKNKIIYQRLHDFISNNEDFDYSFFSYSNKQKLREFDAEFNNKWITEIEPRLIKNYKEQNLNKDDIIIKLGEDKKIEFLNYLNENNKKFNEFEELHPNTKDYILSQQIVNDAEFYYNLEKKQKIENYEKELKKNYIRDLCSLWHEDKMDEYNEKITKETQDEKEKKIKREIENKNEPSLVYNYNLNNKKEIPDLVKKQAKKEKEPYEIYEVLKLLTKPYEKYQEETKNGEIRFYLRKRKYYNVKTSFVFWRIILFIVKLYCSFCNFNIVIYRQMVNSMFGIKSLFFVEFNRDYDINYYNGNIENEKSSITFPKSVKNLCIWIMKSRKDFESTPDKGILGKGCTRIFNIFLNYVLRMFILGSLLIIFYPLIIILNIVICICLIICSPILVLLWTIIEFVFYLIIYNRYDKLKLFPLIRILLLEFMFGFCFQLFFSIICIIIQPLLSIFIFIYSQIHFILRYFYDLFFYSIFKCLGKVPENNSCIAWVTSGPGLFRERYYDIKNKDILTLVIGELEKKILKNYKKKINEILNSPYYTIKNIEKLYKKMGLNYNTNNKIIDSINFYKNKLREQIEKRNFYPECEVNVKFTEERIYEVKKMVEIYITEYSKKNDISFELDKFEEKKVENLAEEILKNIFGNNIFEPLQSTDKIVNLKSVFKNELDEIMVKIFENPEFNDKIYVEERNKETKNINLPNFANFEQIFNGDLNLDLSHLKSEERQNLLKKENILIIKT